MPSNTYISVEKIGLEMGAVLGIMNTILVELPIILHSGAG
jgi:hypothetical protein